MFDKIKPLPNHIFIPKIVPLVYDDTLSYYEFVCKLMVKLEEMVTALNSLGVRVDALEEAVTQLQEIVNDIDDRLTAVEGDVSDIKGDIRDINVAIGNINTAIDGINTQLGDLVINVRNNSNAITQINSAISDIRDTLADLSEVPGDIADIEQDIDGLDTRVTNLESATFGDLELSPVPKNFYTNVQHYADIPYEIAIDYDVRDPDWEDRVQIRFNRFCFRGAQNYNATHLVLKNFVQLMDDSEPLTLAIVFLRYGYPYPDGQAINTTFGGLKSGVNLIFDDTTTVCCGGAKIVQSSSDDYVYDLHLYVNAQNGADKWTTSGSYMLLQWVAILGGVGYLQDGKQLSKNIMPYMNAYNSGMEKGVSQTDFNTLAGRVTTAEGDIDNIETAIGTFTQTEYNTDFNTLLGYYNDLNDGLTNVQGQIDDINTEESVETWTNFSDVFENSVIPQDAIIHHFRMDKKGRMITFELGMINLNDDSTFRYNSYTLGTIRSGLRTKLAPAMDMPVMFTGMLGGTDNNTPKGYLVSGSIPATSQNPPMPQVTGVAIACLYGANGNNYYSDISTYGNLPPYSLIVKLEPWSVTSQGYRNSFIIRGTYLSE